MAELLAEAKYYCISELSGACEQALLIKEREAEPICRVPLITSQKEEQLLINSTTKVGHEVTLIIALKFLFLHHIIAPSFALFCVTVVTLSQVVSDSDCKHVKRDKYNKSHSSYTWDVNINQQFNLMSHDKYVWREVWDKQNHLLTKYLTNKNQVYYT